MLTNRLIRIAVAGVNIIFARTKRDLNCRKDEIVKKAIPKQML
jgi:hypothetical protein